MATATFTEQVAYEVENCCKCGFLVGLPAKSLKHWRANGGSFYCPACGTYQGWGDTVKANLQADLASTKARLLDAQDRERRARQDAEHFEASRNAYKGQVTKLKNRAAAGMCPCCNRTFQNLARHMETKHPEFRHEDES